MPLPKRKNKRGHVAQTRSIKQEKDRAKELGGYATRGSGNGREKGDVRKKGILRLELKTTTKKSFSVTQSMLDKIEEAGLAHDEIPAIEIEFLNENGKPYRTVAVVPSYVLQDIVEG